MADAKSRIQKYFVLQFVCVCDVSTACPLKHLDSDGRTLPTRELYQQPNQCQTVTFVYSQLLAIQV